MLADALTASGLNNSVTLKEAPEWIRSAENREILGKEIKTLLQRQASAKENIRKCAIALGNDGKLHPPLNLWKADNKTIDLFGNLGLTITFIGTDNSPPIKQLVTQFNVAKAIEALAEINVETKWKDHREILPKLMEWFENKREEILSSTTLRAGFCNLPIFPSNNKLQPLTGLVLPDLSGYFQDPLNITSIIDIESLGGYRDFLLRLNVQELTFTNYAHKQIPAALGRQQISPESCRQLVCLLATRLLEIRSNQDIKSALAQCPMIECTDGNFRVASEVYLHSECIDRIFGTWKPIAILPKEHREEVTGLYEWLGVANLPRVDDLLHLIKAIIKNFPDSKGVTRKYPQPGTHVREWMQRIFEHLGDRCTQKDTLAIQDLKNLAWLPAQGDQTRWYQPRELFTSFKRYLFETQGKFLDIDTSVQNKASALINYLGIGTDPTLQKVIDHLLECSSEGTEVYIEVYNFLQQKLIDDINLQRLQNSACLHLGGGKYVRPDQVFWGEHSFGSYRIRLDEKFRTYTNLFQKLQVQETPRASDAISVLREISQEVGSQRLSDEAYKVVIACWKFLTQKLVEKAITNEEIKQKLGSSKVIPNKKQFLAIPGTVFFEDRSNLVEKFPSLQNNDNVIHREPGAWLAMQAADVLPLSRAVKTELLRLEPNEPAPNKKLSKRLKNRKSLIERVTESHRSTDFHGWNLDVLEQLTVKPADLIKVRYHLQTHSTSEAGESAPVYFDDEKKILYYQLQETTIPWAYLAREIAYALNPNAEAVKVTAGIKEVLIAQTPKDASLMLDALGYAPSSKPIPEDEEDEPSTPECPQPTIGDQLTIITPNSDGTGSNPEYWGKVGEEWAKRFYEWLGYEVSKQPNVAGFDFLCTKLSKRELKSEIKAEAKAITFSKPAIRLTINEWSLMMDMKNREKYELLIVVHDNITKQFQSVQKIIRVSLVWSTLTRIFSELSDSRQKLTEATYQSHEVESLIGFQQNDGSPSNNDRILNWHRLINSVPHPNIEVYRPMSEVEFCRMH